MIAYGDMFGRTQRVVIKLMDLNLQGPKENMQAIKMELEDGNFPLLKDVTVSTDDAEGLKDADYAILLGSWPQVGKKQEIMEKNHTIFRCLGHAIHTAARPEVRVILVGNPACTNCHICAKYAKIPKDQFFALSQLDCNRAVGQIALQSKCSVNDVCNVMVWGSHSETAYVDADHCTLQADGASRPAKEVIKDQDFFDRLPEFVVNRGQEILNRKKASSSIATARAIVDHVHALFCGTPENRFVPMGVYNDVHAYDVPKGVWFSLPVKCYPHELDQPSRDQYTIVSDLRLAPLTKEKITQAKVQLVKDQELVDKIIADASAGKAASRVSFAP
jgi:malate dehydrogenase